LFAIHTGKAKNDGYEKANKKNKRLTMIFKALHRKLEIEQDTTPTENGGKLRCTEGYS
jgi:hypothetical protein